MDVGSSASSDASQPLGCEGSLLPDCFLRRMFVRNRFLTLRNTKAFDILTNSLQHTVLHAPLIGNHERDYVQLLALLSGWLTVECSGWAETVSGRGRAVN